MKTLKRIAPLVLVLCLLLSIAPAAGALTLEPSGYELDVSDYAPTQSDETGAIGGNYHLFTFDDFFDLAGGQYDAYKDAVNWWLSCVTSDNSPGRHHLQPSAECLRRPRL